MHYIFIYLVTKNLFFFLERKDRRQNHQFSNTILVERWRMTELDEAKPIGKVGVTGAWGISRLVKANEFASNDLLYFTGD